MDTSATYYEKLPKKRMAVGILFFNAAEELLIVKPTYKDTWSVPGGVVDENESLRDACIREVREELGFTKKEVRLLCVDYMSPETSEYRGKTENLQFIFYGGVLTIREIEKISLSKEELGDYAFVTIKEEVSLFNKNLARRIPKCIEALKKNTAYYLEGGEAP